MPYSLWDLPTISIAKCSRTEIILTVLVSSTAGVIQCSLSSVNRLVKTDDPRIPITVYRTDEVAPLSQYPCYVCEVLDVSKNLPYAYHILLFISLLVFVLSVRLFRCLLSE